MNWMRAENVVWEELDGSALLIEPATGARWALNTTASALWKLCDGRASVGELSAYLQRSREELAGFCEQFGKLGLLAPAAASLPAAHMTQFQTAHDVAPAFRSIGLGSGPRKRPSPRGNSGPG